MEIKTNLKGFKANWWEFEDLTGLFNYDGRPMTDKEIRAVVEWGIQHECETEADIPPEMVEKIIQYCNVDPEKVNQLKLF